MLASVLHTRAELRPSARADQPHLEYTSDVIEVVGTFVYRPGRRAFAVLVTVARRLQSGRLDAYLLYMLIALVAIIAVVSARA